MLNKQIPKKLIPHEINKDKHHIAGWYQNDPTNLLDRMIDYFENNPELHRAGRLGKRGSNTELDPKAKKSTDANLNDFPMYDEYLMEYLQPVLDEYLKLYPEANWVEKFYINGSPNFQKYEPSEGFLMWHCEVAGLATANRNLVFMTYLNDVTDGGETEFLSQDLKVKAEKGLTLIWASGWTHTHRGVTSPTQQKMIVTGWYGFMNNGWAYPYTEYFENQENLDWHGISRTAETPN